MDLERGPLFSIQTGFSPRDSTMAERNAPGSPSAHWRSSVTGLGIENSFEGEGGANGAWVGGVAAGD